MCKNYAFRDFARSMTKIYLSKDKRAMKYFVEGAMVAIAAFYIPRRKMSSEEVLMIALKIMCLSALTRMVNVLKLSAEIVKAIWAMFLKMKALDFNIVNKTLLNYRNTFN